MKYLRDPPLAIVLAALLAVASAPGLRPDEIPPIGDGPYAIGSTNLDISDHPASPLIDYLKGKSSPRGQAYLADLLTHPGSALVTKLNVPPDPAIYGRRAGTSPAAPCAMPM